MQIFGARFSARERVRLEAPQLGVERALSMLLGFANCTLALLCAAAVMQNLNSFIGRKNLSERALAEIWAAAQSSENSSGNSLAKFPETCYISLMVFLSELERYMGVSDLWPSFHRYERWRHLCNSQEAHLGDGGRRSGEALRAGGASSPCAEAEERTYCCVRDEARTSSAADSGPVRSI